MKVANYTHYIPQGDKIRTKSLEMANAMAIELAAYGIEVETDLIVRIASNKKKIAKEFCVQILKDYSVGKLNPPLFDNWEKRTEFTFGEVVVQIFGYMLQISGNDLQDPDYMKNLHAKVDFSKAKTLKLASAQQANVKFAELVGSTVSLDKKSQATLQEAALYFSDILATAPRIKSDEARIAVLIGLVENEVLTLAEGFKQLKCSPADVMRYAAATAVFTQVKLPADTVFPNLKWATRVAMLSFLENFTFDDLSEAFGRNRSVWTKFFRHIHLLSQKDFVTRYPYVCIAARVSLGSNVSAFDDKHLGFLKGLIKQGLIEQLGTGNTVYRTFASRVDSAIATKDFNKIKALFEKNGGYLLRNLMTVSNGIQKKDEPAFINLVREKVQTASAGVLFSILGINVDAKYRVIDQKGDTLVTDANYPKFIKDIQGDIIRTIRSRWGFEGQVTVTDSLKDQVVPFLSKNSDLARGTRYKFEDTANLYFFMHWVQKSGSRTDLDHSYLAFDDNWNMESVWFGNQANAYIAHGGDITNAPAPNGATEYGKIRLNKIPTKIKYIAPVINVFSGDEFSNNAEAYAGFWFSDSESFELSQDNTRYDLSQPAKINIPFIIDVEKKEIVIVDYNNRDQYSRTAHTQGPDLQKIISAYNDKNIITIGKLAAMLSGDSETESLRIRKVAKKDGEMSPESLASIFV
jgi:hypothetical protein